MKQLQTADPQQAQRLSEEIQHLQDQLKEHRRTFERMDESAGVGYVAADDRKRKRRKTEEQEVKKIPKIDGLDAPDALIQIANVSNEIYDHPQSKQDAQQILSSKEDITVINNSKTQKESPASQYTIQPNQGMPGFTRAGNEMTKGQMWRTERLIFEGQPNAEVARQQSWGDVQNKLVKKVNQDGSLDNSKLTYSAIAQELQNMDSKHPELVADAVRTWVTKREVPNGYDANTIAKIGTLMFGQEAQRNPSTLTTAPMVLDLIVLGGKNWKEALSLFPMAPDKAVGKNRELNEYLKQWQEAKDKGTELPRLNKGAGEAMNWNVDLMKAYLDTMGMKFNQQEIKKLMLEFYSYK